jgi:hypothetical protein
MTDGSDGQGGGHKPPKGLLPKLTALLTALASGLIIGKLTNDVSYRSIAIIAAAAGILTGVVQLRQFPGKSHLVVASSRAALILAGGCAVLAVIFPSPWSGYAVLGAALFTVAATVLPLDRYHIARTLGGIAIIGMGISLIGDSVGIIQDPSIQGLVALFMALSYGDHSLSVLQQSLVGFEVAGIGVAISFIGAGVALLFRLDTLLGVAGVGLGVSLIGGGIAAQPLYGETSSFTAWLIAAGVVAAIGAAIAFPLARRPLLGAASIGLGLAFVGNVVVLLLFLISGGGVSVGVDVGVASWLIVTGVVPVAAGIIFLRARGRLVSVAAIGLGLSLISGGVIAQLIGYTVLAVWLIVAGAVAVGAGVVFLAARGMLVSVAGIGLGLSLISGGVVALAAQYQGLFFAEIVFEPKLVGTIASTIVLGAWVSIVAGVAAIGAGVALPLARNTLTGIIGICLGLLLIAAGITGELTTILSLFDVWLTAVGASFIGLAIARLRNTWYVLGGIAAIAAGILLAVPAAKFFLPDELLGGVAAIGAGIALATLGISIIVHPSKAELRRWWSNKWTALTRAPGGPG